MPPETNIIQSGHLEVSRGHKLYFEDWGNPNGVPIIHLHGGPGASFSDTHKAIYDPARHHVLFHDQRGSGRSLPTGNLDHNTTQDLIADINVLRRHLGFPDKAVIAGGSWGSTLALLYAIAHPEQVARLFIWSIYLATKFESDWVYEGAPRHHLPHEWASFLAAGQLKPGSSTAEVITKYGALINSTNQATAQVAAMAWMRWEASLMSVEYDPVATTREIEADSSILSSAKIQLHYFKQNSFIPEDFIIEHISTIKHIPAHITHGRFDYCTPASTAARLADAYPGAILQFVNSGHRRSDPAMFAALQATAQELSV